MPEDINGAVLIGGLISSKYKLFAAGFALVAILALQLPTLSEACATAPRSRPIGWTTSRRCG